MSASYGIAIILPSPTAGQVFWDGPLNDKLQAIVDVLAQRVTVDGLDIQKALEMNGNALIDASAIDFVLGGDPGTASSLFYGTNGELFCRDGSNRLIQLTSNGVLNVAGNGGFGGDYVATNQNGAFYTNATQTFTFTAAGGTTFTTVEAGPLKTHNGGSNAVTVQSPTNLGASYTFTLPTSLPLTTRQLGITSAGQVTSLSLSSSLHFPALADSDGFQSISGQGYIGIDLPFGAVLNEIDVYYDRNGTSVSFSSVVTSPSGSVTTTALAVDSTSTGWQTLPLTISPAYNQFMGSFVSLKASGSGVKLGGCIAKVVIQPT